MAYSGHRPVKSVSHRICCYFSLVMGNMTPLSFAVVIEGTDLSYIYNRGAGVAVMDLNFL